MNIIIALLFIIITILSIIVFKVKGLFTLLISIPLVIMYHKASDIIKLLKKKERKNNDNVNLSERKEVEFVSSRDRKKGVKVEKKEKKTSAAGILLPILFVLGIGAVVTLVVLKKKNGKNKKSNDKKEQK